MIVENKSIFRSLASRNFRLYFMGQGLSLIGTWMQQTAMGWLVYRLTQSAFILGLVSFCAQIPLFVLSPLAGVLADRVNRRRVLILTQFLLMIQAVFLGVLCLRGTIQVWHIIILDLFFGIVSAVDIPTRQSFMIDMLDDKSDLPNAIALNAIIVNVTRLIGPLMAGIAIAAVGEGVCFLLNGFSFLAVIAALFSMILSNSISKKPSSHLWGELKKGVSYAFGFPPISAILVLLAVVSLMGMPYFVLMPVFVSNILKAGPRTLGFFTACSGSGALVASLLMTFRKNVLGMGRFMAYSAALFGLAICSFSLSRSIGFNFLILFCSGFGAMVMMACGNTLLQTITDDDKRGRVMSFYVMALLGLSPIGSLISGLLADRIGAPQTILIGGLCCVGAAIHFWTRLPIFRSNVKPIYIKMGLLPADTTLGSTPSILKENLHG